MEGLAAITAQNGWAMAATGALIVMTGLATLSFIISQLYKIIDFFEGRQNDMPVLLPKAGTHPTVAKTDILNDLAAAARIYQALTAELGETFALSQLYQIFKKENLPHPHLTIRSLREAHFLVPADDGKFAWKNG